MVDSSDSSFAVCNETKQGFTKEVLPHEREKLPVMMEHTFLSSRAAGIRCTVKQSASHGEYNPAGTDNGNRSLHQPE